MVCYQYSTLKSLPRKGRNTSRMGYVLATHFSDQLTGSCSNLLSLQCWAGSLLAQIGVVEPFLHHGSVFGFDISTRNSTGTQDAENTIRLSELYDVEQWQRYGVLYDYAPLVAWETFLQHAPRQLILLDRVCGEDPKKCMACQNDFYRSDLFASATMKFAQEYNFSLVRKSCYVWSRVYEEKAFLELAYGPFKPEESVLLINHFGGVNMKGDQYRLRLNLERCTRRFVPMQLSSALSRQISDYVKRFLPDGKSVGYIGVMIRLQYFAIRHNFNSAMDKNKQTKMIGFCLKNIVERVRELKAKYRISSVFLATDMGKYGSLYFRTSRTHLFGKGVLDSIVNGFYQELFEEPITQRDLTARIEAVVQVRASGYVAQFERNLAANGKCLLLAGGGDFQRSALNLYKYMRNEVHCAETYIKGC